MEGPVAKTYKLSQTFHAPLDFVFKWCTDFRSDDTKMHGGKIRRRFLERSPHRYVWVVRYKDRRRIVEGVRAVWIMPPDAWHLDTCGEGNEYEAGDYKLKQVGRRTRLDMTFREVYMDPKIVPSTRKYMDESKRHWKAYAKYLEKDYQAVKEKQDRRKR